MHFLVFRFVFPADFLFQVNVWGAMADHHSLVELSIDLGNEEEEQAFKLLLSSIPLEAVVLQTLSEAGIKQPALLALLITTDEIIRSLNKQYRGQDKSTDVLSFPLLEKPIVHAPADQLWMSSELHYGEETQQTKHAFITPPDITMHLGDIVISWPTVKRQAAEVGHNPAYELLFLVSHGVLHLVGYDDQTEAGYQTMIHVQQTVMEATGQKA
jgi:probable rRNA maturation factor